MCSCFTLTPEFVILIELSTGIVQSSCIVRICYSYLLIIEILIKANQSYIYENIKAAYNIIEADIRDPEC